MSENDRPQHAKQHCGAHQRKKERKKKDYIKMFDLPAMFLISEVEDHFRGNTEVPVKCLCTTFVLENYALSTPVLHCA